MAGDRSPGAAGAIAGHVTSVKAFHKAHMALNVFHWNVVGATTCCGTHIAGKQKTRHRIKEMEVTY